MSLEVQPELSRENLNDRSDPMVIEEVDISEETPHSSVEEEEYERNEREREVQVDPGAPEEPHIEEEVIHRVYDPDDEEDYDTEEGLKYLTPENVEKNSTCCIPKPIRRMGFSRVARARNHMANERTFLAILRYIFTVSGFTMAYGRLFPTAPFMYESCVFILVGCLVFLCFGFARYFIVLLDIDGTIRGRFYFHFDVASSAVFFGAVFSVLLFVIFCQDKDTRKPL
eukprot:TRINITY_DN1955_c0_g2_i1.p1 TRINITY_DN1955_c0_g2~~TRINITY_DN1955_c0_g2_i1.p1  ORF type:complete len:244 (-),score=71.60 TRINITY_DN1955_c0_g2_i1:11-691(-)